MTELQDRELSDLKRSGQERPWREKKRKTLRLADIYASRPETRKKAENVRYCGTFLQFKRFTQGNTLKLAGANFCKDKFCPMCAWRKSLKLAHQVSRVMDKVVEDDPDLQPIFITLTVRNCGDSELAATLTRMFSAWNKLMQRRVVKRQVKGWFRALEITRNKEDGTYHPHFHAIAMMPSSYFFRDNADYLRAEDWAALWGQSLQVDYTPVVYIEAVKDAQGRSGRGVDRSKAVREVAKYTVKDTDYLQPGEEDAFWALHDALRSRRLFAFGGILKQAKAELQLDDVEHGDLVHTDAEDGSAFEEIHEADGSVTVIDTASGLVRDDLAYVIEVYRWDFNSARYLRSKLEGGVGTDGNPYQEHPVEQSPLGSSGELCANARDGHQGW